jgi:3',5'-cyclic-nucleotide phosphodiesterase
MKFWSVLLTTLAAAGPAAAADGFDIVSLGGLGGIQDGNLSAYLIHPHDDDRAVTCDAGTLVNGLRVADEKGAFDTIKVPTDSQMSRVGYVLTNRIKGYLISHAHLDHVAGLVIASPDDSKKPVYALPSVMRRWSTLISIGRPGRISPIAATLRSSRNTGSRT